MRVLCQLGITTPVVSERFVIGHARRLNLADNNGMIASRIYVYDAAFDVGKRTLKEWGPAGAFAVACAVKPILIL